jgi:hypothetical protein
VQMALPSVNGGAPRTLGLKILRVQGKGGRTDPRSGSGRPAWADRPRPIPARFGRPFAPVGPQVIMHFAPSICMILTMSSSRPRWKLSVHEVRTFTLQSSGVLSGIHPGYSCKEGRIVEDGLLVEFPCTPTRTRSVYSY